MTAIVTSSERDLRTLAQSSATTAATPQPKAWHRPCSVTWRT